MTTTAKRKAKPVCGFRIDEEVMMFLGLFLERCAPKVSMAGITERMFIDLMSQAPELIEEIKRVHNLPHPAWLPTGPRKQLPYGLTAPIPAKPKTPTR